MKECTQEQLDWLLDKRWIRLGSFNFGNCIIKFAANIVKDDIYLIGDYNQAPFGYECDENGKMPSFSYDSFTYMLAPTVRERVATPIRKRLTTTTDVYDIVAKNANSRYMRQAEAALAFLVFSTQEEFVGTDLTDTEEGSHILSESFIVEPDSNLDSWKPLPPFDEQDDAPDVSQDNERKQTGNNNRKHLILQFRAKDERP